MQYEKEADYLGYFSFRKADKDTRPSYNPIPHFHKSTEILIIAGGEYSVYTNGEKRTLKAGSINFVESFKPHTSGSSGNDDGLLVYVMVVSDAYLSKIIDIDKKTFPAFIDDKECFQEVLELAEWNYKRLDSINEEMKMGFVTSLLGILKKHVPFTEKTEERSDRMLVGIMKYISEHFNEDITLELLAREVKYEATYLSRTFNSFFGMNLREYLNRYRISEFLKLKSKNPDEPIYKLARECGFISENTFYRAFNKYSDEMKHNF